MIDILEEYKKYVPSSSVTLQEPIPESNVTEDKSYVTTLVGGDYLSVARARGAQLIRNTSELEMHRLNGVSHAKICPPSPKLTKNNTQMRSTNSCREILGGEVAESNPFFSSFTSLLLYYKLHWHQSL